MYRILEDETYRHWGWEMFRSFIKHTAVTDPVSVPDPKAPGGVRSIDRIRAFTSLDNVMKVPPAQRDNMESFWLAETLKYFYLLFSEKTFLPLEDVVLNTEAHVLPRFGLGKAFKTGWEREFPDWKGKEKV
ncbi:mannosyl-oligosaccharide alpha-1,2-mannosidase [Ascosphaera atra]|nr:mannosyl-oligosaccharide alpha-1,2-mannosidase [Ascosphaera atra]